MCKKIFNFYTTQINKFLVRKDPSSRKDEEEPSTNVTKSLKKVVNDKGYIKYGFSWSGEETAQRP